jgi:hypothetical protein
MRDGERRRGERRDWHVALTCHIANLTFGDLKQKINKYVDHVLSEPNRK